MEIKTVSSAYKIGKSLVKAVGPLIASQFDYAKFKYLDFKQKQIQTEAYREFYLAEAKNLSDLRKEIIRDSLKTKGVERLKAEQDLEFIDKRVNQLTVYSKVPAHLLYLESKDEQKADDDSSGTAETLSPEPSPTWIDRFNELAGKQNEEWRQELLAKAFATESVKPGTFDLGTLFQLSQLDEKTFNYFSTLLSASTKIYEIYWIHRVDDYRQNMVTPDNKVHPIGNLAYQLAHTGLLNTDENLTINFTPNTTHHLQYGDTVLAIRPRINLSLNGMVTTRAGSAIAALCNTATSDVGRKLFEQLEQIFIDQKAEIRKFQL